VREYTGGKAATGAIASDNTATPAHMAAGRNGNGGDRGTSHCYCSKDDGGSM